jgi:hypothetical protein
MQLLLANWRPRLALPVTLAGQSGVAMLKPLHPPFAGCEPGDGVRAALDPVPALSRVLASRRFVYQQGLSNLLQASKSAERSE